MEYQTTNKSNFARTCNRFSQFLKERRCAGEVGFSGIIASPKIGLLHGDRELLCAPTNMEIIQEKRSLDLFPLTSCSSSSENMASSSRNPQKVEDEESEKMRASMTIIYDGKVIVLDDVQDDMAQEIMSLATQNAVVTPQNCNSPITSHLSHGLSELPIARGASLHRFMEKRRNRIAANAPYQVNNSYPRKQLCKQQEEHHLELKLW